MRLSHEVLTNLGFDLVENSEFENISMPYYAKNSIVLFFNNSEPINTYLIGYGFTHANVLYASTFRWIEDTKDLIEIYESITKKDIKKAC